MPAFEKGGITTSYLRGFDYRRRAVDVIDSGVQTTVQDYPGRLGYWHVGVPPSGPMDDLAFRAANRLVGNDERAAGLEIAVMGPTLRIACDTVDRDYRRGFRRASEFGAPVARWQAVPVAAGSVLEMGAAQGAGSRAYLAIAGGIEVPDYLGSKSTFILGTFGGHAGRVLRAGDVLHVGRGKRRARRLWTQPPRVHQRMGNRRGLRSARRARFLHARRTSRCSSPRRGRCTTIPTARASA